MVGEALEDEDSSGQTNKEVKEKTEDCNTVSNKLSSTTFKMEFITPGPKAIFHSLTLSMYIPPVESEHRHLHLEAGDY